VRSVTSVFRIGLFLVSLVAASARELAAQPLAALDPAVLEDVEAAFSRIETRGTHATACSNGLIPKPTYRAAITNFLFGLRNHFQGIQRVGPDYLALSGSNKGRSDLFIIRTTDESGQSPCHGAVVAKIVVEDVLWHAGGLSVLGPTLAVPIHGGSPRMGKVVFYDVSTPEQPRRLPIEIARPGRKASAAALTQLANGRFLVAVLAQFDGLPLRVDFYLSQSTRLADGFAPELVMWPASDVGARTSQDRSFSHFQTINFVRQADGRLYLVGFHNSVGPQAILPGRDYADLYEIVFPDELTKAANPVLAKPAVVKVANRKLQCRDGYCNLDAAAGLFVDPATHSMSVYATSGWLDSDRIKMTVYPSRSGKSANAD